MAAIHETHIVYTVQPGDTLFTIATRFGSTAEAIQRMNALYPPITDPGLIYPRWTLLVPTPTIQPYRTIHIVSPGESVYLIAHRYSAHLDLIAGINRLQTPERIHPGLPLWVPAMVYEVVQGDSLWRIAQRFRIPLNQILYANEGRPGFSVDLLYPGYRLLIPLPSTRNIVVTRPYPGEFIRSGVQVEGFARTFEASVLFQIRDEHNQVVSKERYAMSTSGAPAYGYFVAGLPFDTMPSSRNGTLWVYDRSAKDGSIIDLVQVPVQFDIPNIS